MKKNSLKLLTIALVFTATSIVSLFGFVSNAAAADTYKWGDANHSTLVSSSGTTYSSLGYICNTVKFNDDLTLADGVKPGSGTMAVTYSNESFSGNSQVPACTSGTGDYPAHHIWISSDKTSYIIVRDGGDNKLTGVGSPYRGVASLWDINPPGSVQQVTFNSNVTAVTKPDNNVPPSTEQTEAAGTQTLDDSASGCDNALSPFGWVLCPIMDLADDVYNFFVELVQEVLFFEPEKYNNTDLQEISRIFVGFANIALVIFALLMIASQIFGFEVFSAYTVKKVLPKILIGAVLIQLSWPIFTLLIQFVNALGTGLYWLMMAPFDVADTGYVDINDIIGASTTETPATDAENAGGLLLGVGAGIVAAGAISITGTWLTIILAALGILVSVIVAIFTLVVREVILILLLVLAPLALALWIFPGTQKFWNVWWQSFSKLLLMYPLIMLLLAAGSIAAIILTEGDSGQGASFNDVFAIIAYFAPLFLIGATYKFAGQAFGSIATMSNKFGSRAGNSGFFGLRDRAKISRENSDWATTKKSRDAARVRSAQSKFANRATGSGARSSLVKQLSGIDQDSRNRAQASAAAVITSENEQKYKNQSALAKYQIEELSRLDSSDKTDYVKQEAVRTAILKAEVGQRTDINGKSVMITEELKAQTAVQAFANKDNTVELKNYARTEEGFRALNNLATHDGEAFSVLAKRAPTIAKGDVKGDYKKLFTQTNQRGFDDAIKGFGDLGKYEQIELRETLAQTLQNNPQAAIARLTELARTSNASQTQLDFIVDTINDPANPSPLAGTGLDLGALRNDPNGILKYDPTTRQFTIVDSSNGTNP
jgi:hypothetical protein